jgi:arginyl-tRNA synthetase
VGDKDVYIDAVIERARSLLGDAGYRQAFDLALHDILADIRDDLEEFGVRYDSWFSERSLADNASFVDTLHAATQVASELKPQLRALLHYHCDVPMLKTRQMMRELQAL